MMNFLRKSKDGVFASQTLTGHLLRGAVAIGLLYAAISQQHAYPVWAMVSGILALVVMRGCPVCWTVGLVETIALRLPRWRFQVAFRRKN